jgi:hypothetical protein
MFFKQFDIRAIDIYFPNNNIYCAECSCLTCQILVFVLNTKPDLSY